jgi:hypothetical protein
MLRCVAGLRAYWDVRIRRSSVSHDSVCSGLDLCFRPGIDGVWIGSARKRSLSKGRIQYTDMLLFPGAYDQLDLCILCRKILSAKIVFRFMTSG